MPHDTSQPDALRVAIIDRFTLVAETREHEREAIIGEVSFGFNDDAKCGEFAISVADRKHAANNPKAYFYDKPITIEDHPNSRWIAEPLRLLDCCQETDGAVALVVTSAERAKDLKNRPAIIEAAAQ